MTDLRALCARMADELDHYRQLLMDDRRETHALAAEARTALAQPEPQGLPPRVGHILRLAEIIREVDGNHDKGAAALAEAILSHPDSRWQHAQPEPPADGEVAELVAWLRTHADYALQKAATAAFKRFHHAADLLERLAQPEPQGPSDEDLHQLWLDLYVFHDGPTSGDVAEIARAVLARWGRLAAAPVPLSERLPGPEDCDEQGRCWLGWPQMGTGTPTWILGYPAWAKRFPDVHRCWLPAHALPLPPRGHQ